MVLEKTARAKKVYDQIIANFRSFGNRCYEDTVIKGMPEFFVHYDARFRPRIICSLWITRFYGL